MPAQSRQGIRHPEPVVASRGGDNAAVTLLAAQAQQLGQRATDLERPGPLLMLTFEEDLGAARLSRRPETDERRDSRMIVDRPQHHMSLRRYLLRQRGQLTHARPRTGRRKSLQSGMHPQYPDHVGQTHEHHDLRLEY
jgi:hypothetical protein